MEIIEKIPISDNDIKTGEEIYRCIENAYQSFVAEMHVVDHTPHMEWTMSTDNKERLCNFINSAFPLKRKFEVEDESWFYGVPIKIDDSNHNSIYIVHW